MAIRVNMFGLRFTIEAQPRWKNGQPPHSTTGDASANWIHTKARSLKSRCTGSPGTIPDMESRRTGVASARLTQKRRVMSTTSGFTSSSRLTIRGSKAIPQRGQEPGADLTISGCMGHTYSVLIAGDIVLTGSNAMPHLGQAPGVDLRTSGCMGHV